MVLDQLASARVQVVRVPEEYNFTTLKKKVELIGAALNAGNEAAQLTQSLDAEWSKTSAQIRGMKTSPKVLFILSHGAAPSIAGSATAAHAMIELAGGVNCALQNGAFTGYKAMTAESVVSAAPDVIVTTKEGLDNSGGIEALLARPGLALTPAGRARRVVALDSAYLLGFGPRLPQATLELASKIRAAL